MSSADENDRREVRFRGVVAPTQECIAAAARALQDGHLVAFPTETVYGLGADASNDRAVAAVYDAKGRPHFNPLIVHVATIDAVRDLVVLDRRAEEVAAHFWPGALTLVLRRRADCPVSLLASAGLDTLAVRIPRQAIASALLAACRLPVAAPSANRSGRVSPTTAAHVAESLGDRPAMILDGGPCSIGLESTVVDLTGAVPTILRPGGICEEDLAAVIGPLRSMPAGGNAPRSPGMLEHHYAPEVALRMDAREVRADEALLAFGPEPLAGGALIANLSPSADLSEAAANLFAMLRRLDRPDLAGIAVMPIPNHGLGCAINDRLRRAAAPRSR